MTQNVHKIHIPRQANCAFRAVARPETHVHNTHMSKDVPDSYLRAWRKHCGLTLEEAADRAELSHSQLSRIERGQSDYTKSTLEALAAVYDCTPGDLVSKDPGAQEAEVVKIWSRISAEKRDQARQILETFTDKRKA